MANYFRFFPQTYYNLEDEKNNVDVVTNIMSKFSFEPSFKNNSVIYYEYVITDGETPEMLAHKIYGSAEKHWIILSLNDIVSPMSDWPLEQRSLIKLIDKKYEHFANTANGFTGLEWAEQNIHSYFKVETQLDTYTNESVSKTIIIDSDTYSNVTPSSTNYTLQSNNVIRIDVTKGLKTYYEYEMEQNENKRKIKILKPEFVPAVEEEFRRTFE
jgi:hypothetical protein